MIKHLITDIETIPDPEFAEEWAEAEAHTKKLSKADPTRKILPSVAHHKIVAICCMLMHDYVPQRLGVLGEGKTEEGMLRDLEGYMSNASKSSNPHNRGRPPINFVTWNGRGFDMPCMMARSFLYGISGWWWYQNKDVRYRYSMDGHHDVMDYLSDYGSTKVSKMDVYSRLCGFPGKFGVDGSKVAGMVAAGLLADVLRYCLTDVVQTGAIFLRSELMRGALSLEEYRDRATGYLAFCDADERLKDLMVLVNRNRFLLPQPSVLETYEAM